MTLADLLLYYQDLLAYEYRTQPKARETIQIYAKQALADFFAAQIDPAYDLDTASGKQLDILGKYVGVSRNVGEVLPSAQQYFCFTSYTSPTGTEHGFLDCANPNAFPGPVVYLYQYAQGVPSTLDDEQYRLILKLQIVANSSDGTLYSLQQALATFLQGSIAVIDSKDMSLTYVLQTFPSISLNVLRKFLPRPMTITTSVIVNSSIGRVLDDGTIRVVEGGNPRVLIAG